MGFVGRSRVSCFSLDSPRPWPDSGLIAPFRWAGAWWETFLSLGKNLRARQKEFIALMFFKWAFFKGLKSPCRVHWKIKLFLEAGGGGKVKKRDGFNKRILPLPRQIVFKHPSLKK
jgi:hypothetical protein